MKRRTFLVSSGVAASGATLLGSGAFSSVEADREAKIEVVGDQDAYLYLEYGDVQFGCEADGITIVTVGNQLKDDITDVEFDLQIDGSGVSVEDISVPDGIALGEKVEITADLDCEDTQGSATASFDIDVSGNGASVEAHRSEQFTIACECLDLTAISFIAFCGGGSSLTVELEETRWNVEGEAVGVDWDTNSEINEVILQGGREWYRYQYLGGASSGTAIMDKPPADEFAHADDFDIEGGDNQVKFDGEIYSPDSPCGDGTGTKEDL